MKNKIENTLLKELKKCNRYKDVPVAAVITKNGKIIAKSHNTRVKNNCILGHAEINVINKASKKLKNYFLYDCDLYVTLKPCEMCEKVINNSRINNVYYYLEKESYKHEYKKTQYKTVKSEISEKIGKYMSSFFNNLR